MQKKHQACQSTNTLGFTLIELLVSVGIMLLMVGIGVASYMSFNNRQTVLETVRQLKTGFLLAQSKARAGEIPSGCNGQLASYQVVHNTLTCGEAQLCITPVCTGGNGPTQIVEFSTNGYSVDPTNLTLSFLVLDGGVTGSVNTDITVTYSGLSYSFQVDRGGSMTEGSWN
ncbi:MAG: pilus assembly FimT family protein [Patescibacteria group bacterium]